MNKYFIVTVDTEADWFHQKENRLNNINGLHKLQSLCFENSLIPTYLITYEVATNNNSVRILDKYHQKELCEIGSHLHVWSTPPYENPNDYNVDLNWFPAFQSELPDSMLYDKLDSLHKVIIKNFGISPKSHRAGRWGVDSRTINWLSNNNYLVDSSICSRKTWSLTRGVKGFMNYNSYKVENEPYFPSLKDITKVEKKIGDIHKVLEVPVSNLELNFLNNSNSKSIVAINTIMNKLEFYYFGNISFRPSYNISIDKFKFIVNKLFKKNHKFLNFMLHSNELVLGTSPYSKNKYKQEALIKRIEIVFKAAKSFGYKGIKLSDSYNLF